MSKKLKFLQVFLMKQYAAIGGQAVIEGVMMRSPNAFVVAVRKPNGEIRLRRDQWFGISKKFALLKKPFFRGVVTLIESMANGVVALNYSANIAMSEELKKDALKNGKTEEEFLAEQKKKEKVDVATFMTIAVSFLFGIGLFVFLPHALTALISSMFGFNWDLNSFAFHLVDGTVKAFIFILYIYLIGLVPDIRKVFQYHGAEHKSISTFEAELPLTVDNAKKFVTLHPRCGTSFIFFLLFISILLFSAIFTLVPVGENYPTVIKHLIAMFFKVGLMLPIAGISYELIRLSGKYPGSKVCRAVSFPGMMLQKLTTKEPDEKQLEVALSSIKAVLFLEKKYNLEGQNSKILGLEEIDIKSISEIEDTNASLKEFLES